MSWDVDADDVAPLVEAARSGDDDAAARLERFVTEATDPESLAWQRAALTFAFAIDPAPLEGTILRVWDAQPDLDVVFAQVCARAGYRRAVPRLIARLTEPAAGITVSTLCESLADLGAAEAVPSIVGFLRDTRPGVAESAAHALGRLGGDEAVSALWEALFTAPVERHHLGSLAAALGEIDPSQVEALLAATHDPRPAIRYWSARGLGSSGDPRAPRRLAEMRDDDAEISSGSPVASAARRGLKTWERLARRSDPLYPG
jgi:hypothetical protein